MRSNYLRSLPLHPRALGPYETIVPRETVPAVVGVHTRESVNNNKRSSNNNNNINNDNNNNRPQPRQQQNPTTTTTITTSHNHTRTTKSITYRGTVPLPHITNRMFHPYNLHGRYCSTTSYPHYFLLQIRCYVLQSSRLFDGSLVNYHQLLSLSLCQ